jgi:hypothetical protein
VARVTARRGACCAALAIALSAAPRAARAGDAVLDRAARALTCSGIGAPRLRDAASNPAVARPAAERTARRDARAACRAALRRLRLRGGRTAGEAIDADPALARDVDAALRAARIAGVPRYFADGGVALQLSLPLDALAARLPLEDVAPGAAPPQPEAPPGG